MAKKITVLHITPFFYPNVGGVETHLVDLINLFKTKEKEYKLYILTYQPLVGNITGKRKEIVKNIEIHRISWVSGWYYKTMKFPILHFLYLTPWLFINTFLFLLKKKEEINILHAHGINGAFCAALLKILFCKPIIITIHVEFTFPKSGLARLFYIWPLKKADKILAPTERAKEALINLSISQDRIERFSYWIDQDTFKPLNQQECRGKLGWDKNKFIALFIGRLIEQKGVDILLKVARQIPDVIFAFAGSGHLAEDINELSQKTKNVFYLGRIENKDLPQYYNAADVLVVPSPESRVKPTFEESTPRVILESLSCGTPVLGSDNGGIKEVIEAGKVGLVVKSNVKSYLDVIRSLIENSQSRKLLEENCRQYALDKFGLNNSKILTDSYKELFQRLCIAYQSNMLLQNTGDMALKRRAREIISELDLEDNIRVLDAGCGDGFYAHLIINLGVDVVLTGCDLDKVGLDKARANLQDKKIELVQADLMKRTSFKENIFDRVVMSEVVEHLPDDVKGLKEVYRIMKPGGVLCISVPNANYPFFWDPVNWILEKVFKIHIKKGFWAGIWNQHFRLYKPDQIKTIVEKAGFTVKITKSLTWWCLPFNHYIVNLIARKLASGELSKEVGASLSKYNTNPKRPLLLDIIFCIVNLFDKLNDLIQLKNKGVSVFIKARK